MDSPALLQPFRASRVRLALAAAGFLSACLFETAALACAVCQSGAPPAAAIEGPSGSGLSLGLDARMGAVAVSRFHVDERRLEILASYDFLERYGVDVGLPGLYRTVAETGRGASTETVSLGDLETRFRYLAWRHHDAALTLFVGAKWPTAPIAEDAAGAPLPSALQPGCSSIAPFAGAFAAWLFDRWTVSGIGQILLPFSVRDAPHPGDSVRLAGTAERELFSWLSTRASLSLRLETGGTLSGDVSDPNSGGAILYVSTEAVFRPTARFSGVLGASFPVVQGWFGQRRETPVLAASVLLRL